MHNKVLILVLLSLVLVHLPVYPESIALVGGTVIDISNFGNSCFDIPESVILIEGEKIVAVGQRDKLAIPENSEIINVKGKFILPGLIDGFAALDNQAYANAYLFMGITSIVGIHGGRRAPLFESANPRPDIFRFGYVGEQTTTTQNMLDKIRYWARGGVKFLLLHYRLKPEQVKLAIQKAHELGMATVGELGDTSYKEAINCGIDAFVHSIRYSVELAPLDLQARVKAQPFSPAMRLFRRWIANLNTEDSAINEYAALLGSNSIGLMPTLTLGCNDLPFLDNPWKEPVSAILNPEDIHFPLDRSTGKHNLDPAIKEETVKLANNILRIEQKYFRAGARYLAGSGTDVFGSMPGISLHQELELLTKIGMNERQVIATATSNFSKIFGWKDIGEIKNGKRANILIVDENPMENIKNLKSIYMVILRGKVIERDKLICGREEKF